MSEPIIGAVYRTEADSIVGWCWNRARPHVQCTVEVLIDGALWRELRAERRMAGVRVNGPPHDHFGFLAALPPRGAKPWHRIEVREQRTGLLVGRLIEGGTDPGVAPLLARIDAVREQAAALGGLPAGPLAAADLLGAVGTGLIGAPPAPLCAPVWAQPQVSLVIFGCDDAGAAYRAIASLIGPATDLQAEILVAGPYAELAGATRNVALLGDVPIGVALTQARGDYVLLLDGPRLGQAPDLAQWIGPGVSTGAAGLILGIGRAHLQTMTAIRSVADMVAQAGLLGIEVRRQC